MNYLLSHNQVLQTLLLQKDSHIKPHRNLTPETSKDIEQLSRKVGLAPTQSRILFTTGIGLSDRGFPLRIAAIIIPTLRVIGRLQALGIPNISYRIYQATDFIIDENGLDREKGIQVARILQNYIHEYIQNHHKELEDSIDMQFSLGLKGELIDDVALELSHMHHPSLEKLAHYAQSKGKSLQSAYRYAAANIVSNGHVSDRFPVKNHPSDDLIVVGGGKERPFFELGKYYEASHVQKSSGPIPLVQSTGNIPAYYPQIGEPYIDHEGKLHH